MQLILPVCSGRTPVVYGRVLQKVWEGRHLTRSPWRMVYSTASNTSSTADINMSVTVDGASDGERKINTGKEYVDSLRGRKLVVYLFGEEVSEPVDHPMIRPSVNAVAKTYDLAVKEPLLGSVVSPFTGERVSRFLSVCTSVDDMVKQNKMQRKLGQLTGTCFQRCVGMDAFNALYSVTYEMDQTHSTPYHERFKAFLKHMHTYNYVVGGAMVCV
ncbi:hypothetical protein SARC_13978, partial [Sphaeroforma arctica JP610]